MTTESARPWSSAEAAEIWRRGAARRAQTLAVATERMLEAVSLRPGMRVLDVAAGTGDQSILAARKVSPGGEVLATDISPTMLAGAEQAAREAGVLNVRIQTADATTLELPAASFDAAICRFGLMFMPDLHQALTRVHQALKPGAKFAALVWASEQQNPWIAVQLAMIRDMDRMPSPTPSLVRTIALSEPGKLERAFAVAGFSSVSAETVPTPREFESLDAGWQAIQSGSPAQGELTRAMSDAEREQYAAELRRHLAAYVRDDGRCVLPGAAILGVGTR
jgi:ubiquinone/menaquinone biosynthesis C-methylase UbiE